MRQSLKAACAFDANHCKIGRAVPARNASLDAAAIWKYHRNLNGATNEMASGYNDARLPMHAACGYPVSGIHSNYSFPCLFGKLDSIIRKRLPDFVDCTLHS
jgi:hypothetical protein